MKVCGILRFSLTSIVIFFFIIGVSSCCCGTVILHCLSFTKSNGTWSCHYSEEQDKLQYVEKSVVNKFSVNYWYEHISINDLEKKKSGGLLT